MKTRSLVPFLLLAFAGTAAGQAKLVLFKGTVLDSAKRPLSNAEVSIAGMNLTRNTDDKGEFRFETVSAGIHQVTVRKIGYAQLDTSIAFPEDKDVVWHVTMREKIVTLDSVITRAPMDPLLEEFESNRKRGFGRFMTREDLAKVDGVSLPNVFRGKLTGADIMKTNSSQAYITSKRGPISGCPPSTGSYNNRAEALAAQERTDECLRRERIYYVPARGELGEGVRRACFPQVYVDRQLMNPGRPTPPFDVNSYATEMIEAVEWYESESQTPAKYSVNNARCGVLVLHIRKKK
jgi:hypothetical protein